MADHIVIIGGGPGGYEAAHVAAQLGAEVTVVDTDGVGGSAVLTDCVPISVISSAVAISVLLGTQSVRTAEPPTPSVSTTETSAPSCAATCAAS